MGSVTRMCTFYYIAGIDIRAINQIVVRCISNYRLYNENT